MECSISFQCVSKELADCCPDIELAVERQTLYFDGETQDINRIYCKNYRRCTRLMKFLTEKLEMPHVPEPKIFAAERPITTNPDIPVPKEPQNVL